MTEIAETTRNGTKNTLKRILITRPQPDADAFAQKCLSSGLAPLIEPVAQLQALTPSIDLSKAGAIVFTSANAIRVAADKISETHLPVFCVGAKTACVARSAGFKTVIASDGDVMSLGKLLSQEMRAVSGELVHLSGVEITRDLNEVISARNVRTRRIPVYKLVNSACLSPQTVDAIRGKKLHWVTFFSVGAVDSFLQLCRQANIVDELSEINACAFSTRVAAAAKIIEWRSLAIADAPNAQSMINAITSGLEVRSRSH